MKKMLAIIITILLVILIGIAGNSDGDEYIEVRSEYKPNPTRVIFTK